MWFPQEVNHSYLCIPIHTAIRWNRACADLHEQELKINLIMPDIRDVTMDNYVRKVHTGYDRWLIIDPDIELIGSHVQQPFC